MFLLFFDVEIEYLFFFFSQVLKGLELFLEFLEENLYAKDFCGVIEGYLVLLQILNDFYQF